MFTKHCENRKKIIYSETSGMSSFRYIVTFSLLCENTHLLSLSLSLSLSLTARRIPVFIIFVRCIGANLRYASCKILKKKTKAYLHTPTFFILFTLAKSHLLKRSVQVNNAVIRYQYLFVVFFTLAHCI